MMPPSVFARMSATLATRPAITAYCSDSTPIVVIRTTARTDEHRTPVRARAHPRHQNGISSPCMPCDVGTRVAAAIMPRARATGAHVTMPVRAEEEGFTSFRSMCARAGPELHDGLERRETD